MDDKKLLTETELEMMKVLWKLGEGTVSDVIDNLDRGSQLAYTSVSTILRILEKKDFLLSRKLGRSHTYTPNISKELYEARSLNHVLDNVFDGQGLSLVRQLLGSSKINPNELKKIKELLNGDL
jgi:predicted transcriptional regulator